MFSLCNKEQRSPVGNIASMSIWRQEMSMLQRNRINFFWTMCAETQIWPRSLTTLGLEVNEQAAIFMMNESFCGMSKSLLKSLWPYWVYDSKRADHHHLSMMSNIEALRRYVRTWATFTHFSFIDVRAHYYLLLSFRFNHPHYHFIAIFSFTPTWGIISVLYTHFVSLSWAVLLTNLPHMTTEVPKKKT